jgi:hypothetical protein
LDARKEFGIEGAPKINDPIQRFFYHGSNCARIIKAFCPYVSNEKIKRLNHGYGKGGHRYPGYARDPNWHKGVIRHMKKYEKILYGG